MFICTEKDSFVLENDFEPHPKWPCDYTLLALASYFKHTVQGIIMKWLSSKESPLTKPAMQNTQHKNCTAMEMRITAKQ